MKIIIPSFENNGRIPAEFTCDGKNINPEIFIENVPKEAQSLALIVDDPDSPGGNFTHWLVWNITPDTVIIKENSMPGGAVAGLNDFGKSEYGGPCPFKGEHGYVFKLFALDRVLDLSGGSRKAEAEKAMNGHILDKNEYVGRYSRV